MRRLLIPFLFLLPLLIRAAIIIDTDDRRPINAASIFAADGRPSE